VATVTPRGPSSPVLCKVCDAPSDLFGETELLRKYRVQYYRCEMCGFIQTESPYWLEEAYSSAIAIQDVGIMRRNLVNCEVTSAVPIFTRRTTMLADSNAKTAQPTISSRPLRCSSI